MRLKNSIAACGFAALLATLIGVPALAQSAPASTAPVTPVCANCHESPHSTIMLTAHGAQNDASGSSCQACHGDASLHLKDPAKNKPESLLTSKTATAAEKSGVCLSCHGGSRHLENWAVAKHRKVDVTCVNCHSIHGTQTASNNSEIKKAQFAAAPYTTTVRQLVYKRCVECHRDVRAEITKPSHHPIIEGKVGCQDCHDPHGSLVKASLRNDSVVDLCTSCHADKRGPWIHEHPPVEENCAICHTPHGSAHKGAARAEAAGAVLRLPRQRPYARHLRRPRHAARDAAVEHPLRSLRVRELSSADPRQQRAGVRLRRILPPLRPGNDHEIKTHCHSRGRPLCATRVRRRELHVGRIRRGRWTRHEHQRCQPQWRVWQHRTAFGHQPADAVRRPGGRRQGAGVPEHQQRADRRDRHPRWQQRLLPARLRRGVRPR